MPDPVLEQRINRLEEAMAELARESALSERDWRHHRAEMRRISAESAAAAAEQRQRDEEWRMRDDELRREMRREIGELSRRLGTMAEDLVAPSVGRILRQVIGAEEDGITTVAVRVRRRFPQQSGLMIELDVVAVCGDYVLVNETKSHLMPEHIPAFVARLATLRDFFPEYTEQRLLGAIASLYVDESLVRLGERQGLIVLGFGEDLMDVLNSPGFMPREF